MNRMTTYLLDSNVFIQAKNLYYGFDFCPAFWDWSRILRAESRACEVRAGKAQDRCPHPR